MKQTDTKKVAIMQPYFFPYIGYWQLIHAADRFVFYDDVNFNKGGWVNRNRILISGKPKYITMPLQKASQHKRICDLSLVPYGNWRDKLIRSIEITYRKAPFFQNIFPIIEDLIRSKNDNLSEYLTRGIKNLSDFMGIDTEFVNTSRCYDNNSLHGQDRILDICRKEGATVYVNPIGGRELYNAAIFENAGIRLCFLRMQPYPYTQRVFGFTPNLSIIDALMEVGPERIKAYLEKFDLIVADGSMTSFP